MASPGALHTVSHPCLSRLFLQQLFAGRRGVSAFGLARLQDPVSGSLRCQIQAIGGVGECGKKAKQIISLNKNYEERVGSFLPALLRTKSSSSGGAAFYLLTNFAEMV